MKFVLSPGLTMGRNLLHPSTHFPGMEPSI